MNLLNVYIVLPNLFYRCTRALQTLRKEKKCMIITLMSMIAKNLTSSVCDLLLWHENSHAVCLFSITLIYKVGVLLFLVLYAFGTLAAFDIVLEILLFVLFVFIMYFFQDSGLSFNVLLCPLCSI